jgi:hydrogenase expression/formation protein HypC
MCLGVPGKVLEIWHAEDTVPMGKVEFRGNTKDICLVYLPEVEVGDFILVNVGFANSKIGEDEAREIFSYMDQIGEFSEYGGSYDALPPEEIENRESTR